MRASDEHHDDVVYLFHMILLEGDCAPVNHFKGNKVKKYMLTA